MYPIDFFFRAAEQYPDRVALDAPEGLQLVSDGNADLARALGLEMDASGYGMGIRARRFALYAEDGVVRQLFVEAPGEFKVSSADYVLEHLD